MGERVRGRKGEREKVSILSPLLALRQKWISFNEQFGQERIYVASFWIKTEAGFGSNSGQLVFHSKIDDDYNNAVYPNVSGALKTVSVGDTQGQWVYVEAEIDLKNVRQLGGIPNTQLLRLRVYPVSYDNNKSRPRPV